MSNDFTEQARQLALRWQLDHELYGIEEKQTNDLADRMTSALAEAATQGQVVGLEMAASELDARYQRSAAHMKLNTQQDRAKNYGCWQDLTYAFKHAATAVRSLSPDPSYLNRVRNKAATVTQKPALIAESEGYRHGYQAALEQAAQMLAKGSDGVGGDWEAAEAAAAITKPIAIGDDKG